MTLTARIDALARADRRRRLRAAIAGTVQDRWDYCVLRSTERDWADYHVAAAQSVRNYQRLTRLGERVER